VIALGFDFDHTLGLDNKLERTVGAEILVDLANDAGAPYDESSADAAMVEALGEYRSGAISLSRALAGAARRAPGVAAPLFEERFRAEVFARAPSFVTPLPGVHAMFAELAALGVSTAIFTNGWSPLQEAKARAIGYDGTVIVSDAVGIRKPDRAAFVMLANALAVDVSDLWYVGDDPHADIGGAIAAGATGVWYDWEERAYPVDILEPTFVIHALSEIGTLVQGHGRGMAKRR